ncbi:hypothetical protein IQ227_07290 [Anabaena aphanizomenioides LEGE 00250]|uniref:Uncharacterized protein n=1 Tax=Sphaerospermopsis aphanizomenoides LEGE 00250 TaxID=2777972 RepID=A0ABR9VEK4_9CYAN|nr:hypothetical protein [Sphaerospermopsis aphanizomenoides]MBE9235845.1 hypothetical protein [Sphaerospermopsis aphanizomenoides LEGE 00250]
MKEIKLIIERTKSGGGVSTSIKIDADLCPDFIEQDGHLYQLINGEYFRFAGVFCSASSHRVSVLQEALDEYKYHEPACTHDNYTSGEEFGTDYVCLDCGYHWDRSLRETDG